MGAIVLMMEAVSTSEMSVSMYQTTRRNVPEDSHLHTLRRENLKFYQELGRMSEEHPANFVKGPKNRNNPSIRGPQQESEWVFS
jgi:hypothetical protein